MEVAGANVVGRIRFALERSDSPRHSSHVAQLFSLGLQACHETEDCLFDTVVGGVFFAGDGCRAGSCSSVAVG
jgi:hypothetical protein